MTSVEEISWLRDVFSQEELKDSGVEGVKVLRSRKASICLLCKGGRLLCGKSYCPIVAKAKTMVKLNPLISSDHIEGSTPPSVFVGRMGYPKVALGPMVPPYYGDTELLDTPEHWVGRSILDNLQELAMGANPTETEVAFTKKPRLALSLDDNSQPFGPSAPLLFFKTSNINVDRRVEKAFSDGDLKASEAVMKLYREGVMVTRIQRPFSLGMFGLRPKRRLVPTRWSITAVDNTISLRLIDDIKQYETIDEYRVYTYTNLDNRFVVILMPQPWRFEWIEAWFPGTTWNVSGATPAIMGDWEDYEGRKTYASVGGCYYSARLATAENLSGERRQAATLLLREIHPGYILPVGVWNVRESVRRAFETAPDKFDSLGAALAQAMKGLTIPIKIWTRNSVMLRRLLLQKKITDFLKSR
jgi:hypothetical protein